MEDENSPREKEEFFKDHESEKESAEELKNKAMKESDHLDSKQPHEDNHSAKHNAEHDENQSEFQETMHMDNSNTFDQHQDLSHSQLQKAVSKESHTKSNVESVRRASNKEEEQVELNASNKMATSDSKKLTNVNDSKADTKKKTSELNKVKMQQLAEDARNEKKNSEAAIQEGKTIFNIECCINCEAHSYCTHHEEVKYATMFTEIKTQVEASNSKYYVAKNFKISKPRIGAFEIFHNETLVYSKLSTMQWPKVNLLVKRLQNPNELGGKENQNATVKTEEGKIDKSKNTAPQNTDATRVLKAK